MATEYRPIGQKEDPPRNMQRRRIRVSCAVEHCVLPGGHLALKGEDNWFDAYEDDVPKIVELVECPKETAEGTWEADTTKLDEAAQWLAARKAEHADRGGTHRDYTGPRSIAEAYAQRNPTGKGQPPACPKPLRRVEVAAEVLPPPASSDDKRARAHAEAMMGASMGPLAEALNRLAERLDKLEDNSGGRGGKNR